MTFQPGQSGNPSGRPRGARNKRAVFVEQLLEGETEAIVQAMIARAKQGDIAAVRLCIDRICPRPKDTPVAFELPPLRTVADAAAAMAAITAGVADGTLTAREAADLARIVDAVANTLTVTDHEERLKKLEDVAKRTAPRK
jgi:hypothetical protein